MNFLRRFHKLVLINGKPKIGAGTRIGIFSEVYDKGGIVTIGGHCDIASFVAINCADSHRRTIGYAAADAVADIPIRPDLAPISIGDRVFIGSHSFIGGGVSIGHHSVVGAGTILRNAEQIPPWSLVVSNDSSFPPIIREGVYEPKA